MTVYGNFCSKCAAIQAADQNGSGSIRAFESQMSELLDYCHSVMPAGETTLVMCFHDITKNLIEVPLEVLGYCMHELRLKAFLKELEEIRDQHQERTNGLILDAIGSFRDDWENRDMYERYATSQQADPAGAAATQAPRS